MEVRRLSDAREFLDQAGPLMLPNEARDNLVFGIAGTIVASPGRYEEKAFWVVTHAAGPVGAALRTAPYYLVVATPRDESALAVLATAIDDDLPGVVGGIPEAEIFARLWAERHGLTPRAQRRQGVYALEQLQPVPRPSGTARVATEDDRPLLLDWMLAFGVEVLEDNDPGRIEAAKAVDERLRGDEGGFLVWEDGGPVSIAGWGGPTPNGIRIGPVYTPPDLRGRGYATALTAELSQRQLDAGRRFCFLFTDLANPTSNAIYERIGYVRVGESAMIRFERD